MIASRCTEEILLCDKKKSQDNTGLWIGELRETCLARASNTMTPALCNASSFSALLTLAYLLCSILSVASKMTHIPPRFCRDSWVHNLTVPDFEHFTCAKCLVQLFRNSLLLSIDVDPWPPEPPYVLINRLNRSHTLLPDPQRRPSLTCQLCGLPDEACDKWRQCCQAARHCCRRIGREMNPTRRRRRQNERSAPSGRPHCPATWDGVTCWPETPASNLASQPCPAFYTAPETAWTFPHAHRLCTENGTWYKDPIHQLEKTDVASCVDKTASKYVLQISLYVAIAGNIISILALVASIGIIVGFRSLRRDLLNKDSQKLHLNLFVAMILISLSTLAFNYVYFDVRIIESSPIWCRGLYALTIYLRSVTYMAMFAEGLYLHRRISRVLYVSTREPLRLYVLFTWLVPVLTVTIFIICQLSLGRNSSCWMHPPNNLLDLIHMVPNVTTLVCNIGFLVSIEVNLCTKMRTDSSDRRVEVLRHALRATLSLIPVFGLQFLFIAYRPVNWPPYEIIAALFMSTQGFLVAILYCFSTKEVRNEMYLFGKRSSLGCRGRCGGRRRHRRRDGSMGPGAVRRDSTTSALKERCLDMQGYLYLCQRQARNSLSYQAGRRSLPDVIDSMSLHAASATRTTSLASSLHDAAAWRDRRRSSCISGRDYYSSSSTGGPRDVRRPSAMSLGMPLASFTSTGVPSNSRGLHPNRSSFVPLLGGVSSDYSSTGSGEGGATHPEEQEMQEKQLPEEKQLLEEEEEEREEEGEQEGAAQDEGKGDRNHDEPPRGRKESFADVAL